MRHMHARALTHTHTHTHSHLYNKENYSRSQIHYTSACRPVGMALCTQ